MLSSSTIPVCAPLARAGIAVVAAVLIGVTAGSAVAASPGAADPKRPTAAAPGYQAAEPPLKSQLDKVFGRLTDDVKTLDSLIARLRSTAQKTPEDAKAEAAEASKTLGEIADRLKPSGEVANQLQAVRNAANVHRKRIADMAPKDIDEADRQTLIGKWDAILQSADILATAMADMRSKMTSSLENVRIRQTVISEMILAGHFEGVLSAMSKWLSDLETTMGDLHAALAAAKPTS